jgi:hypothetical protein
MLMTVDELRLFIDTDKTDFVLESMLAALELEIRGYTNNGFSTRTRSVGNLSDGEFTSTEAIPFKAGDTVCFTGARKNHGKLAVVSAVQDKKMTLDGVFDDEWAIVLSGVDYPTDVKMGAVNIIDWKLRNAARNAGNNSKAPVQSETISRHSVTYATDSTETDLDAVFGVPKKHTAFLQHYKKARF